MVSSSIPTRPFPPADPWSAGRAPAPEADAGHTRLSGLNESLLQDLLRFESQHPPGHGLDLLEVLAAALRHDRALQLQLQAGEDLVVLALLPASRQIVCRRPLQQLLAMRLSALRVLRVEPAPDKPEFEPQPMAGLAWELAQHGARAALLPEIDGVAAYRINPAADLRALALAGPVAAAVQRLRQQTTTLRELADFPGFDTERGTRLLNGLYLQSALIVTRSHPGAIG